MNQLNELLMDLGKLTGALSLPENREELLQMLAAPKAGNDRVGGYLLILHNELTTLLRTSGHLMKATIEPTPELYDAPINGVKVPVRIWKGTTTGGVPIEAYVLSITPDHEHDIAAFKAELPPFMQPSRETYTIDTRSEAERRAQHIHDTGGEPPDQR